MNCEFAGYADEILAQKGVTCKPVYWSERDDWTMAMVAAGLGFAFMPCKLSQTPRRGGFAGRRAGVLATGKPRERKRASLFTWGRLAGARGDAEDVVRQTTEALLHCCVN